jgi:hypothetical protein
MKIPMSERRVLVRNHAREYQRKGVKKKEKGRLLDHFVKATGFNRVYAARLLRNQSRRIVVGGGLEAKVEAVSKLRRKRDREYGEEVVEALKVLWRLLDYPCGKRMAWALAGALESLEHHGEMSVRAEVREKLLRIGAATIDRLLAQEKRKYVLKNRGGTKPGSLLKNQIEVRTFAEWDEEEAGFVEIDLVAHDGGSSRGDYTQTLDVTDVHTGWSEQRAVLNKAQTWVFQELKEIRKRLPFALKGVDSDNGGEFINAALQSYCEEEEITFTRSRPYRKNDNCFVEQKNYSIVRRTVGYGRLVGPAAVAQHNTQYDLVRLRTNFFRPCMKLIEKKRQGSRVTKRYDKPQTPYQRLLESAALGKNAKRALRHQFRALNLAELDRKIRKAQNRLMKLTRQVSDPIHALPDPGLSPNGRTRRESRVEFLEVWASARDDV